MILLYAQKAPPPEQDLCGLRTSVQLAQEVGTRVG